MELKKAVIATLIYHDIFNYPLRLSEINRYLIGKKAGQKSVEKALGFLIQNKRIGKHKNFFFLKGKKSIVNLRLQRQRYSVTKLKKAKLYAQILKLIPSVKLVAVSGALAMGNSHKGDDIDLVIVTSKNLIWTTRFVANILLWLFKRDPHGQKKADRACLNLFLDESALKIQDQNLYTAHEIAQLKPLWDRRKTYSRLIKSNNWLQTYLPNWKPEEQGSTLTQERGATLGFTRSRYSLDEILIFSLRPLETILKNFQLAYMKSKITTEKIGDKQLFFHPQETQEKVLKIYNKKIRNLHI